MEDVKKYLDDAEEKMELASKKLSAASELEEPMCTSWMKYVLTLTVAWCH